MDASEMVMLKDGQNVYCIYNMTLKSEDGEGSMFVYADGNLVSSEPQTVTDDVDSTEQVPDPLTIFDLAQMPADFEIQVKMPADTAIGGQVPTDFEIRSPVLDPYEELPVPAQVPQEEPSVADAVIKSEPEVEKFDSEQEHGLFTGASWEVLVKEELIGICHVCGQVFDSQSDLDKHVQSCDRENRSSMAIDLSTLLKPGKELTIINPADPDVDLNIADIKTESLLESLDSVEVPPAQIPMIFTCRRCNQTFDSFTNLVNHRLLHSDHIKSVNGPTTSDNTLFPSITSGNYEFCNSKMTEVKPNQHSTIDKPSPSVTSKNKERCNNVDEYSTDSTQVKLKQTFACEKCPKRYSSRTTLKLHMLVHTGEKPHECETCGMKFARRPQYARHMIHHTGNKPHKCDLCGKQFAWLDDLRRHKFSHTGSKPFICEVCGMKFVKQYNAREHMKTRHMDIRTFACEICGKMFHRMHHVQQHMRAHTGEKPFSCPYCEKCFSQKWCLQQHITLHSGVRPFQCEVCGRSFSQKHSVKQHMKIHKM